MQVCRWLGMPRMGVGGAQGGDVSGWRARDEGSGMSRLCAAPHRRLSGSCAFCLLLRDARSASLPGVPLCISLPSLLPRAPPPPSFLLLFLLFIRSARTVEVVWAAAWAGGSSGGCATSDRNCGSRCGGRRGGRPRGGGWGNDPIRRVPGNPLRRRMRRPALVTSSRRKERAAEAPSGWGNEPSSACPVVQQVSDSLWRRGQCTRM